MALRLPQARDLDKLRRLLELVRSGISDADALGIAMGAGARHARRHASYYREAADILGLVEPGTWTVTARGVALLDTRPGTGSERSFLRAAIAGAQCLGPVGQALLSEAQPDEESLTRIVVTLLPGSSLATTQRRVRDTLSWRRRIHDVSNPADTGTGVAPPVAPDPGAERDSDDTRPEPAPARPHASLRSSAPDTTVVDQAEASSHPWQEALTRRLRTLVRTAPLHRVEQSKGHRGELFNEQDLRALALRTLDLVIERMGLGTGATLVELRDELVPLVRRSAPTLSPEDGAAIAEAVVLAMLNEGERRQAFAEPYLQITAHGTTRKELQFHLLREREVADGTTVVFATTEGINLYAGMLDYPVEDAQIADEAVLHAQVQRGRIHDAVQTARRARLRSLEFEQKILGLLETVRRDIGQVDWLGDVLLLLDGARTHVGERLGVEREIRRAVETRLDAVTDPSALLLVDLRDTLDECIGRHTRLHRQLIGANRTYLDEQERQTFRPRAAERLPDLEGDVLCAAIAIPTGTLAAMADAMLARLQAPHPPPVLRLGSLVDRLLASRRAESDDALEIAEPELEALPDPAHHFTELDEAAVNRLLSETRWPTTLSEILAAARERRLPTSAIHLLTLRVLRAFDPDAQATDRLQVADAGRSFRSEGFAGRELHIDRRAEGTP